MTTEFFGVQGDALLSYNGIKPTTDSIELTLAAGIWTTINRPSGIDINKTFVLAIVPTNEAIYAFQKPVGSSIAPAEETAVAFADGGSYIARNYGRVVEVTSVPPNSNIQLMCATALTLDINFYSVSPIKNL